MFYKCILWLIFFSGIIINIFFSQTNQGKTKKCYIYLERLPEHVVKKSYVKVDNIYKDKVSNFLIYLFYIKLWWNQNRKIW